MKDLELRSFDVRELRAEGDGEKRRIVGYAAVFEQLSNDLGGWFEKIQRGAFANSLETGDQRALWNHNTDYPLGRRKAGTLTLEEDEHGLRFEITPPNTQYARDMLESVQRGDVDQMSFMFRAIKSDWRRIDEGPDNEIIIRTLIELDLYEVSPVVFPAYPQTSAQVRALGDVQAEFENFLKQERSGSSQAADAGRADQDGARARLGLKRKRLELADI